MLSTLVVLALSAFTEAHFRLTYPYWRGDPFAAGRSQWSWPCANVSQENSTTNRTAWPLTGGSLVFASSHDSVFAYANLGIGDVVTGFNITLMEGFNQTGNGTVCLPTIGAAELAALNIAEGTTASIQVITVNHQGNALYNCADIVFTANATILSSDQCKNSTGVSGSALTDEATVAASGSGNGSLTSSGGASSSTAKSDASVSRIGVGALLGGAALAVGALLA